MPPETHRRLGISVGTVLPSTTHPTLITPASIPSSASEDGGPDGSQETVHTSDNTADEDYGFWGDPDDGEEEDTQVSDIDFHHDVSDYNCHSLYSDDIDIDKEETDEEEALQEEVGGQEEGGDYNADYNIGGRGEEEDHDDAGHGQLAHYEGPNDHYPSPLHMPGSAAVTMEYSAGLIGQAPVDSDSEASGFEDVDMDDLLIPSSESSGGTPQPGVPNPDTAAVSQTMSEVEAPGTPISMAGLALFNPADAWIDPVSLSNPNPATIGPSNYGLADFLRLWARQGRVAQVAQGTRDSYPCPVRARLLEETLPERIEYDDLQGDECDLQGIDWDDLGVTRRSARERRLLTYTNYVNIAWSDRWKPDLPDISLPRTESFFRFRQMDIKRDPHLAHFQLRNLFAGTSHSRVFYPAVGNIQQYNPMSGCSRAILRFSKSPVSQVSTLAAGHGVLIAGSFGGEYVLRHLDSGEPDNTACRAGVITNSVSGITNHVAVHRGRTSSMPFAAFASNDNCVRRLDIATETWLAEEELDFAPNCTALSPDGRLRVIVGDSLDVVIAAAEAKNSRGQAEILHRLSGHRDYGFACDWADDGWTIATSFQDKAVKIWDARRLTDSSGNAISVCTLRSEMAGVRSLRFSPIGSGKRVLVAAEEADFVNIINAQTFKSKQTVDIFGELGGISFANGGRDLMVLCCDRTHGGILQLERCAQGDDAFMPDPVEEGFAHGDVYQRRDRGTYDWPRSMFNEAKYLGDSVSRRRRRAAAQVEIEPF